MSTLLKNSVGINSDLSPDATELVTDIVNISKGTLVDLAEADQIGADDDETAANVFAVIESEAYKNFTSDLLSELARRQTFQEVADRTRPAQSLAEPTLLEVSADIWYGVEILLPISRYQSLFLNYLYCRTLSDTATTVRVFDVSTGEQLGTDLSVTLKRNQRVELSRNIDLSDYENKRILVAVLLPDGTQAESCGAQERTRYTCQSLHKFADGITPQHESLSDVSTRFVAIDYEIRFSLTRVIDQFYARFSRAFCLYCAEHILNRITKSKKASLFTQVNRIEHKESQIETREEARQELANALRPIHQQLREELVLRANSDDQPGYYVADLV